MGSSGALVAAIYNKYCTNKISAHPNKPSEIKELKNVFSWMESYFHGKSSGIDPTICYLGLPLLIQSKDKLGTVTLPEQGLNKSGAVFLLNSGSPEKLSQWLRSSWKNSKRMGSDICSRINSLNIMTRAYKPLLKEIKRPYFQT